jgi:hypothetical protein
MPRYLLCIGFILCFCQCGMKEKMEEVGQLAGKQFGDQHFKTAISLIELHKIRFGHYPESLDSLKYLSEWDLAIKLFVKYEPVDSGYSLDLVEGIIGKKPAALRYPDEFWKGLGLRKSNLKKEVTSAPL